MQGLGFWRGIEVALLLKKARCLGLDLEVSGGSGLSRGVGEAMVQGVEGAE